MKQSISSKHPRKTQLYHYFNELSRYINNEDDLSVLLGYSVLESLFPFKSKTKDEHRETQRVYKGLNDTIVMVSNNGFNEVFHEMKEDAEKSLRQLYEAPETQMYNKSLILRGFIESARNSSENYQEHLRLRNLDLYHIVSNRGPLKGERSECIKNDFSDIYNCYIKEDK